MGDLCGRHMEALRALLVLVSPVLLPAWVRGVPWISPGDGQVDGWMDGWKEHRDLGLKILSQSRVGIIMNHDALPATAPESRGGGQTPASRGVLGVCAALSHPPAPSAQLSSCSVQGT